MRSREEYVRFINERTGFDIGSDDPTLVFLACFELFEKDFRELAKNTLGSWIPLLDSRRKSFDDTVRLRTERVLHEAVQQTREAAERIAGDMSKKIQDSVKEQISFDVDAVRQRIDRMEKIMYAGMGCAAAACLISCAALIFR